MSTAGPLPRATMKLRRRLTTAQSACHVVANSAMRSMEVHQ